MKSISAQDLRLLSDQARELPRLRKNLNLHERLEDPIQRLCNSLEPGTYIRPHRHPDGVWECFVLLSGACTILVFEDNGVVVERVDMAAHAVRVAEIPAGAWHGIVALEPGTQVLEIKPGPYVPGRFADWAPEEGSRETMRCLSWLKQAQPGERLAND